MDVTVTQENLAKALSIIGRVASGKTQLPILGNILLRTSGNRLLIAATNLEIASSQLIGAKITTHGSITVPAKLITEFVTNLPKDTIHLFVKTDKITITSGGYTSTINGVIADEFPELPTIDEARAIQYSFSGETLKEAIQQVIITASTDTTRPVLTGVFWHSLNGFIYLAATDGYRLSEKKLVATKSDIAAIIPVSTLQEVLRSISDTTVSIDVVFDDTQVHFKIDDIEIISRLIDGAFPDYTQLIPKELATTVEVKKDELSRVIKIAGLFSRDSGGGVTLNVNSDKQIIFIHSIASEFGENTSEIPAKISGSGEITLNSKYLTDALSVLTDKSITLGFNNKLSQTLLHDTSKSPDYNHIIMPLKR